MGTVDSALGESDNTAFAIAMSNLVFGRHAAVGFASLSLAEQTVYCIDALEREVNNGGFEQFLVNSSGDVALETIDALERVGAPHTAGLARSAVAPFPSARPDPVRATRQAQVKALPAEARDKWNDLDSAFYEYQDNLAQLLRAYVQSHRSDFASGAT